MIREILEKNEYTDWYIVQPDKHNPATSNAKCVLFNFVEQKPSRANNSERVVPTISPNCKADQPSRSAFYANRNRPYIFPFFPRQPTKRVDDQDSHRILPLNLSLAGFAQLFDGGF